jgi:hypothetical protein
MLRNYYINKEWMVSYTARRIYRIAAALSLALFFFLTAVRFTGGIPENLLPFLKVPLFACVLGAAITMVAMEYFLFGFDNSPALKKVFLVLRTAVPAPRPTSVLPNCLFALGCV